MQCDVCLVINFATVVPQTPRSLGFIDSACIPRWCSIPNVGSSSLHHYCLRQFHRKQNSVSQYWFGKCSS